VLVIPVTLDNPVVRVPEKRLLEDATGPMVLLTILGPAAITNGW
jgi:hypothetical protein